MVVVAAQQEVGPQPTLESAPQPLYPRIAKEAGIGGRITVRVVVDAQGAIVSVDNASGPAKICDSSSNDPRVVALRESVIEAIKQAKFSPAMKNGQPVKSVAYISSTFDPTTNENQSDKKIVPVDKIVANAVNMPKPAYPGAARAVRAAGPVSVRVVVNEEGNVFTAEAVSGHPLLRSSAEKAACGAKFTPMIVSGKPVLMSGIVTYVFKPN